MFIFTLVSVITHSLSLASLESIRTSVSHTPLRSPCMEDRDPYYDGIRVNCQNKGISSLPLPAHWIPMGTSSLLLDYNSLSSLDGTSFGTFPTWTGLRFLGLSHNSITYIKPFTFSKLASLRELDLNENLISLDNNSMSGQEFTGLCNLTGLELGNNNNHLQEGNYPTNLLNDLTKLERLTLDTFKGPLDFNKLFHALKSLSSLVLTGGMTRIKNESFDSITFTNLTKLFIRSCEKLNHTEPGSFMNLKNLTWYELSCGSQGPRNTLESLAPFVNRNMSHLNFSSLSYDKWLPDPFAHESIITVHMARFLTQICVQNFAMTSSLIFMIDSNVVVNPLWINCLQTLDVSQNPLQGELGSHFLRFASMNKLEVLKSMNLKNAFSHNQGTVWNPPGCPCKVKPSNFNELTTVGNTLAQAFEADDEKKCRGAEINTSDNFGSLSSALTSSISFNKFNTGGQERKEFQLLSGVIHYYCPKRLKFLIFNSCSDHFIRLNGHAQFINCDNVEEIHLSDNGISYFTGSYSGLPKLKLFDISKNIGTSMSPTFFKSLSSIIYLNMAEMKLDTTFMELQSSHLFSPLRRMSTLNLSRNDLRDLPKDIFDSNLELQVLLLARNRFESIPFEVSHVPRLCQLDMSGNSLTELSEMERTILDRHTDRVRGFYLSLDGNPIHCGCGNIRFLSWLSRTKINLDNQRNYSCTLDSGLKSTTGAMQDLDAVWRKCYGEMSFMISLILCLLMISGFFFFFLICKFKKQLRAFLLMKFWPSFIMKTPADYTIGVYIGYADHDIDLACHRLRPFIEEKLRHSTYVRHRDLLPASDMAEAIVEALHSSWRLLFIVSHQLCNDPWSYFALKTSTYATQVENPGRIVLIVIDDDNKQDEALLCKLPTCVLKTVQTESIVRMTSQGHISYEDKQALITALLFHGSFFDD